MKLKLAVLVAGALIATGANAQFDVGYELGATRFDLKDGTTKNRANNNVKIGYSDERNGLGVEGVYAYTPKAKFGSGNNRMDQSAIGTKLLAKAEIPFAQRLSGVVKGGMGYQRNQINYKVSNATLKEKEYFPAVALGVNYKATDQLKVGVNVNHDRRSDLRFKDNTYLSAGFNYAFDSSKFA